MSGKILINDKLKAILLGVSTLLLLLGLVIVKQNNSFEVNAGDPSNFCSQLITQKFCELGASRGLRCQWLGGKCSASASVGIVDPIMPGCGPDVSDRRCSYTEKQGTKQCAALHGTVKSVKWCCPKEQSLIGGKCVFTPKCEININTSPNRCSVWQVAGSSPCLKGLLVAWCCPRFQTNVNGICR